MNIIWLTTVFDDSAVSNILLHIAPYLKSACTIHVISLESTSNLSSKALDSLKKLYIEHTSLDCKKTQLFAMVKKLEYIITHTSTDIVHAHLGRAYLILLLIRSKQIIKLATFHNNANYFNSITYKLLKIFYTRFDAVSTVSYSVLSSIQSNFDKKKIVATSVIYNPVFFVDNNKVGDEGDDVSIEESEYSIRNSAIPTLLVVGRLVEGKGHDLWISMLPILADMLKCDTSSSPFQLWCVGSGNLKQKITQLCNATNISSYVEMLGYRHDIKSLMYKSDIILFPSQNEGFGLVPCEALLLGKAVVTHCLPVMKEILQDDVWLVDCTNPTQFAQKVLDILSRPSHYQTNIVHAQNYIRKNFSPKHIAQQYLEFYRKNLATVCKDKI